MSEHDQPNPNPSADAAPATDAAPAAEPAVSGSGQFRMLDPDEIEGVVEVVDEEEELPPTNIHAELEAKIDFYRKESQAYQERMLRVAADFENFKRRAEREKDDVRKFGVERLLLDMLPVLDNLDRALSHAADATNPLLEGVHMVLRQFKQALAKYGVTSFDSKGEPFDPTKHEAVQQVDSPDHANGTVIEEYQKGYYLHDRLIRPAMVVVSRRAD
jgi:molecular chaperone GrpE